MDVKSFIAPDVETRVNTRMKVNNYAYYIIIGLVSLLVIFVPPLCVGSLSGDLGLMFPHTTEEWILWSLINGSTAIGNMSFLFLFKLQAKKNSSKNPNYLKAQEILNKLAGHKEVFIPRSPAKLNASDYTKKLIFILIGSVASFVTITSIVISFDIVTLISTLCSAIIAIAISWTTMVKDEEYWTEEYLLYAEYMRDKLNPIKEEQVEPEKEVKENA